MTEDLPVLQGKDVVAALRRAGFLFKRQAGSHVILYKPGIRRPLSVPVHQKDLPVGTLRALIREANLTVKEFVALLKRCPVGTVPGRVKQEA